MLPHHPTCAQPRDMVLGKTVSNRALVSSNRRPLALERRARTCSPKYSILHYRICAASCQPACAGDFNMVAPMGHCQNVLSPPSPLSAIFSGLSRTPDSTRFPVVRIIYPLSKPAVAHCTSLVAAIRWRSDHRGWSSARRHNAAPRHSFGNHDLRSSTTRPASRMRWQFSAAGS